MLSCDNITQSVSISKGLQQNVKANLSRKLSVVMQVYPL